jgi:hypothetical protein
LLLLLLLLLLGCPLQCLKQHYLGWMNQLYHGVWMVHLHGRGAEGCQWQCST